MNFELMDAVVWLFFSSVGMLFLNRILFYMSLKANEKSWLRDEGIQSMHEYLKTNLFGIFLDLPSTAELRFYRKWVANSRIFEMILMGMFFLTIAAFAIGNFISYTK